MEPTQFSIFQTVLKYVIFILVSPVLTFFTLKFLFFEGVFGISTVQSNIWSAVMAVVMLHIAVGLYIYRAYFEADKVKGKPTEKVD